MADGRQVDKVPRYMPVEHGSDCSVRQIRSSGRVEKNRTCTISLASESFYANLAKNDTEV